MLGEAPLNRDELACGVAHEREEQQAAFEAVAAPEHRRARPGPRRREAHVRAWRERFERGRIELTATARRRSRIAVAADQPLLLRQRERAPRIDVELDPAD